MTNEQGDQQAERESVPRSGVHPEQAQGQPGITPEADGRPTHEGTTDYHPAQSVPDEPLKPQD